MPTNEEIFKSPELNWRCIGPPRGGRVVAVAGDYSNPMTFYFGACAGGVWKTTDGGTYWECISDGFFNTATIGALAVAPSDSNVIYAGTGETTIRVDVSYGDGIYKSEDAGRTWSHIGLENTKHIGEIRVHPQNPDIVYVAAFGDAFGPNSDRGVYRSFNGGKNWEKVLFISDDAGAIDISMDMTNPRILFASTWEARRQFWHLSSGGKGSGLYRSMDSGDTWEEVSSRTGFAKGLLGKIGVSISSAKQGRIYCLVEADDNNTGLYVSQNYGESWELVCPNRDLIHRPWYYTHIFSDPLNADTVYVTNFQMWKSIDGGRNFSEITTPHGDNHDLWIDPNNPLRMIEGNDGGACVSFNGGDTWSTIYNQNTAQFYRMDVDNQYPYRVYATQQDNTSISVPSQAEWGMITMADSILPGTGESGFIAVSPTNTNVTYVGAVGSSPGGNGALQRYDHETRQMQLINVWPEEQTGFAPRDLKYRFAWTFPILFSPHNSDVIYVGGNHVFKSQNEGMSWEKISPDLSRKDQSKLDFSGGPLTGDSAGAEQYATCSSVVESIHREGEIWAATDDGLVHVTRDGGKNWHNVTPKSIPEWAYIGNIEISVHDPDTIYLAATRYKLSDYKPYLFKTSNGGKTWNQLDNNFPKNEITRVIRSDTMAPGLLFVGTETGIYISTDDGKKWNKLSGKFPVVPVYDLKIKNSDLVVATHGRSFWILDNIEVLRQNIQPNSNFKLFAVPQTVRQNIHWSSGIFNGDGKDYSPAFGVSGASYMSISPNGKKERKYLDTGENPPNGAIIYFWLNSKATHDAVSLNIKDNSGKEIISFSNDNESKNKLELLPGLNKLVWDLCQQGPTKQDESLIKRKYEPFSKSSKLAGGGGVKVLPGVYNIELSVDGVSQNTSFELIKDPRITTSHSDLKKQHNLAVKIVNKLSQLNIAINRCRLMSKQLDHMLKVTPKKKETIQDLLSKLELIEGRLINAKRETPSDVLRHPAGLDDTLKDLLSLINIADAKPPTQSEEVAQDIFSKINNILGDLDNLVNTKIKKFNSDIGKLKPPVITARSVFAPKTGW